MKILSPIFTVAVLTGFHCAAETTYPVLAWSARVGPELKWLSGTAVGSDGAVTFVGRTAAIRNTDIYVGTVSADGTSLVCSASIGGAFDDYPLAMAMGPDSSIFVAGFTGAADFPITPEALQTRPAPSVLLRTDTCGRVRWATYLPPDLTAAAVAAAPDGSVYVVMRRLDGSGAPGRILWIDGGGRRVLASLDWNGGLPGAAVVDSTGRLLVTGARSTQVSVTQSFVTRFTADLKREFDTLVGDGGQTIGTALAVDPDGSIWLGAAATPPGERLANQRFTENSSLPYYDHTAATLSKLSAEGSLLFHRYVEVPAVSVAGGYRRPTAVGIGPDGRVWLALAGSTGFPQTLPEQNRIPVNGTYLRSFDRTSGAPTGGDTMVPGMRSWQDPPAVAFGPSGRVATAALNSFLPPTAGSAGAGDERGPVSVVTFELNWNDAPRLDAQRELLQLDQLFLPSNTVTADRLVEVSADQPLAFVADVVPDGGRALPPGNTPLTQFVTGDRQGTLPATLRVRHEPETRDGDGVLTVLAPGAQGVLAIPVRRRTGFTQARGFVSVDLPAPSNTSVRSRLPVSFIAFSDVGQIQLKLPFRASTSTRWLRLDQVAGITPAELAITIDPRGLATGTYNGEVRLEAEEVSGTANVTLVVGPLLRVSGLGNDIPVPLNAAAPFQHEFTVTSSSTPISFRVESNSPRLSFTPPAGVTPSTIGVTFDTTGLGPGSSLLPLVYLNFSGGTAGYAVAVRYILGGQTVIPIADRLLFSQAAPGSLMTYNAGTSKCEAVPAVSVPWPETLGGCTLRLAGQALPISTILRSIVPFGANARSETFQVTFQIPYDAPLGDTVVELEDREGRKTALGLRIMEMLPQYLGVPGLTGLFTPVTTSPGEQLTLLFSGLGQLNGPARAGELTPEGVVPLKEIEFFVGGRPARVLGVAPSRTEVGVFEIQIETPRIAADSHSLSYRIADGPIQSAATILVQ